LEAKHVKNFNYLGFSMFES